MPPTDPIPEAVEAAARELCDVMRTDGRTACITHDTVLSGSKVGYCKTGLDEAHAALTAAAPHIGVQATADDPHLDLSDVRKYLAENLYDHSDDRDVVAGQILDHIVPAIATQATAKLRSDLESERQVSADYHEEILAAHAERDTYRAGIEALRDEWRAARNAALVEVRRDHTRYEAGELVGRAVAHGGAANALDALLREGE